MNGRQGRGDAANRSHNMPERGIARARAALRGAMEGEDIGV
jgi:hypothetical protein